MTLAVPCVVILVVRGVSFQFWVKEDAKLRPMEAVVDVTNPSKRKYHCLARLDLFNLVQTECLPVIVRVRRTEFPTRLQDRVSPSLGWFFLNNAKIRLQSLG